MADVSSRYGAGDNSNRNVNQVCKQKEQTAKSVKIQQQKMKVLQEKPPFVTGIVHHRIGSPYKSESNCVAAITRCKPLSQKTNIQKTNRGLRSAKPKCCIEARGTREKAVIAKGTISLPEAPQKPGKMCEEMKMERDCVKCVPTLRKNVNISQPCTSTSVDHVAKLAFAGGAGTNNFISEDKENCHENKNITDVTTYREELDRVVAQLESSCNEWIHFSAETNLIPEDITELINIAIGQTKLLIKEKLHQYRGLINECASSSGPLKVTEDDLHGFWDMVSIQVGDVQKKFEHLATLKQNGWNEPERVIKTTVPKRKSVAKQSNIKKVTLRSSLREHIAAMRKMKKVVEEGKKKSFLEENPLVTLCNGGTKSIIK